MKKIFILILISFYYIPVSAIQVVELPLPKSDKIVIRLEFRNGSISDPKGKEGLTALTATLVMDGGTAGMSSSQIKDKTYPWASRWYASVDKEVCTFTFEFHKDHIRLFYPILLGLTTNPAMDESDFNRLKSNQANFVNQVIRASSDEEFSKMGLEDLLFRGTNYQHMVRGTTSGVESITVMDAMNHYKNFFSSQNLTIGIAGNYPADFLSNLISDLKKNLPGNSPVLPEPGKANQPNGIHVEIISKTNALGSAIFTGFPLPITRKDDSFAALMIANSWLGEHRKSYSRLYQKIREQRSMNYGNYSYIEWYENGGSNMLPLPGYPRNSNYFSIWIRPVQTAEALKGQYEELSDINVGHAHFALRMALREMNTMIQKGMSEEDFNLTRDFLRSYMKLYIQTPAKQLGFLMDSKFYDRINYIEEMDKLLASVSLADVNKIMRSYWQTESMFVCIVTDDSEAEPLKRSLLENNPSPMAYSNALKETLPAEIINEDEEVAKFKLNVKSVRIVNSDEMFK